MGDVERADQRAGKGLGIRSLGHGLAGAVLLPPRLHLRQLHLHLRQRRFDLVLHDVNAQGLQFVADDVDGGAAGFLAHLGGVEPTLHAAMQQCR
jgi:hypothetical protein